MSSPDEFYRLDKYADEELTVLDWLKERRDNCLRLAETHARGKLDRAGWMQDAYYFTEAIGIIERATSEEK